MIFFPKQFETVCVCGGGVSHQHNRKGEKVFITGSNIKTEISKSLAQFSYFLLVKVLTFQEKTNLVKSFQFSN